MSIPPNLLPINTAQISSITNQVSTDNLQNRLSTSVGTISTITGSIADLSSAAKQRLDTLEAALPDSIFEGDIEQIEQVVTKAVETYVDGLPTIPSISSLSSLIPTLPVLALPRPSYGEIKDFIERKLDEIKKKRQEAFMESQKELVNESRDAFKFRENIVNNKKENLTNVLNRNSARG